MWPAAPDMSIHTPFFAPISLRPPLFGRDRQGPAPPIFGLKTPITTFEGFQRTSFRRTHKPLVAGSNPAAATRSLACISQKPSASDAIKAQQALGLRPFLRPFVLECVGQRFRRGVLRPPPSEWRVGNRSSSALTTKRKHRISRCDAIYGGPALRSAAGPTLVDSELGRSGFPSEQGLDLSPWRTRPVRSSPGRSLSGERVCGVVYGRVQ